MVETVQPRRFGAGQQSVKPANSSRRLLAAFEFATTSHFRAVVFLMLCSIVLFVLGFVTRRGAALAALLMASCVLLGAEARLAKTDAMLLLSVTAAMGTMARIYLSWQRGED